jgi:hypothetical protein
MISSKFRRNAIRRPRWNQEDIQSINQLQILLSNHDRQVGELYLGEEEVILR